MNAGNLTQAAGGTIGMGAGLTGLGVALGPLGWAGLAAANLLPAILGSSAQERQRRREADLRAAEIEASPWTGRGPSTQMQTPESNVWANLLGAGTNVLGQGQALEKARRDAAMQEQQSMWNQMLLDRLSASNAPQQFQQQPTEVLPGQPLLMGRAPSRFNLGVYGG